MNFNFNDNLFGGLDDDIEKEIINMRKGPPAAGGGTAHKANAVTSHSKNNSTDKAFLLGHYVFRHLDLRCEEGGHCAAQQAKLFGS